MIHARLDLSEFVKLKADNSGPGLDRKLGLGMEESGALVEARGRATAPVGASQVLRGSHYHKPIRVAEGPGMEIGVAAAHAIVVHEGRKPGSRMAPPGALTGWMRFKGIEEEHPAAQEGKWGGTEFAIAKSMAVKGTKGRPWLREAFEKSKDAILSIFARVLSK